MKKFISGVNKTSGFRDANLPFWGKTKQKPLIWELSKHKRHKLQYNTAFTETHLYVEMLVTLIKEHQQFI